MQTLLFAVATLLITVSLAVAIYIFLQGEHDVRFVTKERSELSCERIDENKAVFSLSIPYRNFGKQEGIMTDAFARVLLPKEQYELAKITGHLENAEARRNDDYMEAFIVRIGAQGEFILTLEVAAYNDLTLAQALAGMVDFTVDIYYEVVGRTYPMIRKASLTLLLEEFQAAAKGVEQA